MLWLSSNFDPQVGRSGKTLLLLGHGLAAAVGVVNGSQVFTASLLTVLRHISLTVALAVGSAHVTGLGKSIGASTKLVHITYTVNCQ